MRIPSVPRQIFWHGRMGVMPKRAESETIWHISDDLSIWPARILVIRRTKLKRVAVGIEGHAREHLLGYITPNNFFFRRQPLRWAA
jgi:hypothetical protein